ncbi:MAG: hypothetical protein ACFFEO_05520 [Candidatus Thorarchaeota archaeon]
MKPIKDYWILGSPQCHILLYEEIVYTTEKSRKMAELKKELKRRGFDNSVLKELDSKKKREVNNKNP